MRQKMTSHCKLIIGPMFSGKTTRLLQELNRFATVNKDKPYAIITAPDDKRETKSGASGITSHNIAFKGIASNIKVIRTYNLDSIDISPYDVIGIDEAQFQVGLVAFVRKCLLGKKYLIVSGLDGTYDMMPFESNGTTCNILDIIPMCGVVTKLAAVCKMCIDRDGLMVNAPYTAMKKSADKPSEGNKVIGGSDMFMPVCFDCHAKVSS